jgi:hypothetical protein
VLALLALFLHGKIDEKHSCTVSLEAKLKEHVPTSSYEDHVWFEDRWMVASLCDE